MARKLVLAGIVTVLAPLLCLAVVYCCAPIAPLLLSISTASSAPASVLSVPVPQPLSLQPAVSAQRALNVLPLWHGRLDEDVMANPPPPFFARAPFAHMSSPLRSATTGYLPNVKIAAGDGVHDSYEDMKTQYDAQEESMRHNAKVALGLVQPAHFDDAAAVSSAAAARQHLLPSSRPHISRVTPRTESKFRSQGSQSMRPYGYSHAGFVRDTSFYKAANSRAGTANFDANLASTVASRRPRLAHDLLHTSAAVVRRLRRRQSSSSTHSAAQLAHIDTHSRPSHVVSTPIASMQPLLPTSLRRKLFPHDTSFYQAANSRTGIANFDAHLAAEIQVRRPDLSQDLKRISAAILSAPLSSLTPLLPSTGPLGSQAEAATATPSPSNHPQPRALIDSEADKRGKSPVPSVTIDQAHHAADYNAIFEQHSSPTSHFPQQEEAWIHFAASGASFGGKTKEQQAAVKKVRTLARQYFKEKEELKAGIPAAAKKAAS